MSLLTIISRVILIDFLFHFSDSQLPLLLLLFLLHFVSLCFKSFLPFCLIMYRVIISPHIVQAIPLHRLPILATTKNVSDQSRVFLMAEVGNGKN